MKHQITFASNKNNYLTILISLTGYFFLSPTFAATQQTQLVTESEFFQDIPAIEAVTRLPQPKSETPAAVTIIDHDMIIASGARILPDVFRLVPGFQVAYYDMDIPIVTYHGLADVGARRLLVLIDGRSAYGAFSGSVNWSNLNIALDDIERIEIIRGPNTVTYGDNAFLCTINIVTRHASQTQGFNTKLASGNHDIADAGFRYGTHFSMGDIRLSAGYQSEFGMERSIDDFRSSFANLRADLGTSQYNTLLIEMDYGKSKTAIGQVDSILVPPSDREKSTHSEQLAWQHQFNTDNTLGFKIYHNYSENNWNTLSGPINAGPFGTVQLPLSRDAIDERYDAELSHSLKLLDVLRIAWGIGAREDSTQSEAYFITTETLKNRSSRLFGSVEWHITEKTVVNSGGMWEKNDITGTDFSPRVALNYHINNQHTVRMSWSRANRLPSLAEENIDYGLTYMGVLYDQDTYSPGGLKAETMDSYELGYLGQFPSADLSLDMRLYRDQIKNFINYTVIAASDIRDNLALSLENGAEITVDGLDIELSYRPDRDTRIVFSNAFMTAQASNLPNNSIYTANQYAQTVPSYSGSLLATQRITPDWNISTGFYWVDQMLWLTRTINGKHSPVDAYTRLDLRIGRHIKWGTSAGELALIVQNAGDNYQDFRKNKIFDTHTFLTLDLNF